jgi:hypothetical protein
MPIKANGRRRFTLSSPFPPFSSLLDPQPADNPSSKQRMKPKISLFKNAFARLLLLLHIIQKIQIESNSILPIALAISLFANILFFGKYAIKRARETMFELRNYHRDKYGFT